MKMGQTPGGFVVIIPLFKACGLRSQAQLKFCLTLRKIIGSINLPKARGPRSQA